MASLKRILLLINDVPRAAAFYNQGLGLEIRHATPTWAELCTGPGNTPLCLGEAGGEAAATTGYSPLLSFNVDDIDATVTSVLGLGGTLDGAIRYEDGGRIAAVRSPDGQMLTLFEPTR
jgi:predicted enzyme related to lactoylglutathione lyase